MTATVSESGRSGGKTTVPKPSWGTAIARVAVSVFFLLLSVSAAAQTAPKPNNYQQKPFATRYPDLLNSAPIIHSTRIPPSTPTECDTVSIASTDPWIRTADLTTRILATPDFVLSGIQITPEAEHADLSLQLAAEIDEDETRIEYLTATSAKMNLEERISFLWPASDYEEFISEKVLRLLFMHCIARRDEVAQQTQLPPELVTRRLLTARTIKTVVRTSWMRDKVLLSALKARPEFAAWGIKPSKDNKPADFNLVVGHILSTLTWTYRLIDTRTGALMDSGTVMAFHDERAATRIAAAVVKQISERRPLPALLSKASQQVDYAMPGTWKVKAASEDMLKRFPDTMRFVISNGIITATDLKGATLFSISANKMIDFADTKAYDTIGDNFRWDEDDVSLGCDDCAIGLLVYVPILLVLDQFRSPVHIFEIAWLEDNVVRVGSFRVSSGDYEVFLTSLNSLVETQVAVRQ